MVESQPFGDVTDQIDDSVEDVGLQPPNVRPDTKRPPPKVMLLPDTVPRTIGRHRPTRQCRSSDAAVVRSRFRPSAKDDP